MKISKIVIYCLVTKLYLTLCDPIDGGPPDSSVHGISQARILEWVAIPYSRGSSQPRDQTCVSCIVGGFFTTKWCLIAKLSPYRHRTASPAQQPHVLHSHFIQLVSWLCLGIHLSFPAFYQDYTGNSKQSRQSWLLPTCSSSLPWKAWLQEESSEWTVLSWI